MPHRRRLGPVVFTLLVAAAATITSAGADARSITWARAQDAPTLDPHVYDEGVSLSLNQQIYEPLLLRDGQGKSLPALAESWTLTSDPLVWEFRLRRGVAFHDGTPFTADDVVFSLGRARQANAGVAHLLASIDQVIPVESHIVRIRTRGPTPLLPASLTHVLVMSKAWSEKHAVAQVADRAGWTRAHTFRNANGTGPFVLVSREIGQRTVMRRNESYWGRTQTPVEIAELIYRPIPNDSERVQALVAGDVDLVQDVPVNELPRLQANKALAITTGPVNRTVFLGLNVGDQPLASSDVKDKNPLADRRVREAINVTINRQMIQRNVLLGQAIPTGTVAPSSINGYPRQLDRLPQADVARAKTLLAEAGWPNGFTLKLDCPRQVWGRSEAICASVAAQLKSVGITADLEVRSPEEHLELIRAEPSQTDFFLLGLDVPSFDSEQLLNRLFHTRGNGAGRLNATRFSNAEVDKLIGSLVGQLDFTARGQAIAQAWRIVQEETVYVPLHVQTIAYAMKADLTLGVDIENQPKLRFARIRAAQ